MPSSILPRLHQPDHEIRLAAGLVVGLVSEITHSFTSRSTVRGLPS